MTAKKHGSRAKEMQAEIDALRAELAALRQQVIELSTRQFVPVYVPPPVYGPSWDYRSHRLGESLPRITCVGLATTGIAQQ